MSASEHRYWFPAKRYGWGWGTPTTWQGWAVLIAWLATVMPISVWLAPQSPLLFCLFLAIMLAVLLLVCYAKGEPPQWRWGGDGRRER